MNIKTLTTEQLKVMAYDSLALIEQNQKNLQIINQEITSRVQVKQEEVLKDKEK